MSPPLLDDDRNHLLDELLLTGRTFKESDALDAPKVAIVNEVFAGMAALGPCGREPLEKAAAARRPGASARSSRMPAASVRLPTARLETGRAVHDAEPPEAREPLWRRWRHSATSP